MFIVTRIWISISDLDLNSIIESHNENLKNLLNFIIIIKMANGMGSFAFFGFISRPWHFWAKINYHCDPFDTRTPNFYFLGWFSDLFFWPKKRCAFWLRSAWSWSGFARAVCCWCSLSSFRRYDWSSFCYLSATLFRVFIISNRPIWSEPASNHACRRRVPILGTPRRLQRASRKRGKR